MMMAPLERGIATPQTTNQSIRVHLEEVGGGTCVVVGTRRDDLRPLDHLEPLFFSAQFTRDISTPSRDETAHFMQLVRLP